MESDKTTKEVNDFCDKFNITIEQFYGIEEIKGDLDLSYKSLCKLPDGFNPKVSGSLRLNNNELTYLPDGFNPVVGVHLYLYKNQLSK